MSEKYKTIIKKYIETENKEILYTMNAIEKGGLINLLFKMDEFSYDFFEDRNNEIEKIIESGNCLCETCEKEFMDDYNKRFNVEFDKIWVSEYSKINEKIKEHELFCTSKQDCNDCEYICQCGCGSCLFMSEEDQEGLLPED